MNKWKRSIWLALTEVSEDILKKQNRGKFLLHPTAQFVMSFPKYKNLRQKGLRPQDINAATKIDDNSFKKRHKKVAKTPEQIEARNQRLARFKIRNRKEIARKKREEASDEPRRKFKINMDLSVYRVSPE